MNVTTFRLQVCRQFDARYIPYLMPSTVNIIRFTLCKIWTQPDPALLQFRIFRIKYSNRRISDSMAHMATIRGSLYSKFAAEHSARYPV